VQEALDQLDALGRIIWPKKEGGVPSFKQYIDDMAGSELQDVWTDIPPISAGAAERLGYPTQKPVELLKRIVSVSSNPGDLIFDPFCGCGTTIAAVETLNQENPEKPPRKWIGIDITHLAINLIKYRLHDAFGDGCRYAVVGEPVSLPDAQQLANEDPYQFQWWALSVVNARPAEKKKGADKGIDGRLYFHDEAEGAKTKQVIFSVKGGSVQVSHVRDLVGVLDREKAEIGVMISMEAYTKPMREEAASAGFYQSPSPWGTKHPRIQLLTIEDLLAGKKIDLPPICDQRTFKKAPRVKTPMKPNSLLFDKP
jgi:hypothetical protein